MKRGEVDAAHAAQLDVLEERKTDTQSQQLTREVDGERGSMEVDTHRSSVEC